MLKPYRLFMSRIKKGANSKIIISYNSNNTSEKLEWIFFLEMWTPFAKITSVVLDFCILTKKSKIYKMSDCFSILFMLLYVISTKIYDQCMCPSLRSRILQPALLYPRRGQVYLKQKVTALRFNIQRKGDKAEMTLTKILQYILTNWL